MAEDIFTAPPAIVEGLRGLDPMTQLREQERWRRISAAREAEMLDVRDRRAATATREAQATMTQRRAAEMEQMPMPRESAAVAGQLGQLDPTADDFMARRAEIVAANPLAATTREFQETDRAMMERYKIIAGERREIEGIERQREEEARAYNLQRQREAESEAHRLVADDPELLDEFDAMVARYEEEGIDNPIEAATRDLRVIVQTNERILSLRQMGMSADEIEKRFGSMTISPRDYAEAVLDLQQRYQQAQAAELERLRMIKIPGTERVVPDPTRPEPVTISELNRTISTLSEGLRSPALTEEDREEIANRIGELTKLLGERAAEARSGGSIIDEVLGEGGSTPLFDTATPDWQTYHQD